MDFHGTWHDARETLPGDGQPVAAAVTGRYPDGAGPGVGEHFWLVMPMHFRRVHLLEDSGETLDDCFVDSDLVVRRPLGVAGAAEVVTHWAELPPLPGTRDRRYLLGDAARAARAALPGDRVG